jgi:hypothetical protein
MSTGTSEPAEHRPPRGLQAERTTLAWVRTALVCAALATTAVHLADTTIERAAAVVVGGAVAIAGLTAAWLRMGGLHHVVEPPPAMPAVCAALLAGSVILADVTVLAIVLL